MSNLPKEIYAYELNRYKIWDEDSAKPNRVKYIRASDVQPLIEALRELTNGTQHSAAQYERARKALEAFDETT